MFRRSLEWLLVAFIAIALLPAATALAAGAGPLVDSPAGLVRGTSEGGLRLFRGIPYAGPPIGDARWKPPSPLETWEGEFDASTFRPACYQPTSRGDSIYADAPPAQSEDCLFLNIWAPADADRAPVFVWIHGGSLRTGAGSQAMYDGSVLAQQGLVVVSINYRLGILGYLAHPQLSGESPRRVSGNYGLLDQIAALEWVQQNIGAFGGDPDRVTVAGESAGALSVMYLMASPSARGLFSKAIVQSAYMLSTPALREKQHGMEPAEAVGEKLAEKLGADDIGSLREMDPKALVRESTRLGYTPWGTIDGVVLPRQIVDVFDRGEQAPVPLIAGYNTGEIRSLRFLLPEPPGDVESYEDAIRAGYGDLAESFLSLYPSNDIEESMLAATRDAMYGWTAQRMVTKQAEIGAPGFLYVFDHGYPAADKANLHAFHASELPYIFGTLDRTPPRWPEVPDTQREHALSKAMTGYWSSFARAGKPRAPGQPAWRPFSEGRDYMRFGASPVADSDPFPGMYALHEEVVCRRRRAGDIPWHWNVGVIAPELPPELPQEVESCQ